MCSNWSCPTIFACSAAFGCPALVFELDRYFSVLRNFFFFHVNICEFNIFQDCNSLLSASAACKLKMVILWDCV